MIMVDLSRFHSLRDVPRSAVRTLVSSAAATRLTAFGCSARIDEIMVSNIGISDLKSNILQYVFNRPLEKAAEIIQVFRKPKSLSKSAPKSDFLFTQVMYLRGL